MTNSPVFSQLIESLPFLVRDFSLFSGQKTATAICHRSIETQSTGNYLTEVQPSAAMIMDQK
ncbi:hypothetical protein HWD87_09740 [Enterococcus gallinarum]|nr:hypothetical protein [Enterococcus gallinarum]NVI95112.1 hypothetical protein [Enterococcus gallinarum]